MLYTKSKKGISPLIATVLLIGFTIILAALVMRWGSDLLRQTTQTTSCQSEAEVICVQDVELQITGDINHQTANGNTKFQVLQNGPQKIKGLQFRLHFDDGSIQAITLTGTANEIDAFSTKTINTGGISYTGNLRPGVGNCDLQGVFCGFSILPIISHETASGEICEKTCPQEARHEFVSAEINNPP